jgi:hypothetical protein
MNGTHFSVVRETESSTVSAGSDNAGKRAIARTTCQ